MQDVDITIPVQKGTKGRDLEVVIKKKHLKVGFKGKEPIVEVGHLVDHLNCLFIKYQVSKVSLTILILG